MLHTVQLDTVQLDNLGQLDSLYYCNFWITGNNLLFCSESETAIQYMYLCKFRVQDSFGLKRPSMRSIFFSHRETEQLSYLLTIHTDHTAFLGTISAPSFLHARFCTANFTRLAAISLINCAGVNSTNVWCKEYDGCMWSASWTVRFLFYYFI